MADGITLLQSIPDDPISITIEDNDSLSIALEETTPSLTLSIDTSGSSSSGSATNSVDIMSYEDIPSGKYVNIFLDSDVVKVRLATNNDTTKSANGYVKSGITSGETATVYLDGVNNYLSGLTAGEEYFLGEDGAVTSTAPSAESTFIQKLGVAYSSTKLFNITNVIIFN